MNTDQLKLLAERASTLEDRTATRLPEVHERIASARRRRVVVAVAGASAAVVALVLGVQLITDAPDSNSPDPAPDSDAGAAQPEPGTCWMASEDDILNDDFRIESEPVPCTEPHNLETAQVVPLSEATVEQAQADLDACWEYVRGYVGIDPLSWIPWGLIAHLPSEEQIDAGASWMRCDAVFPTTWDFSSVRTSTSSAADIADNPPVAWMACFDRHPDVIAQPFVPCDRPHLYEQTGMLASYPRRVDLPLSGAAPGGGGPVPGTRDQARTGGRGRASPSRGTPRKTSNLAPTSSEPASRTARTERRCRREGRATTYWWAPWDSNPQPREMVLVGHRDYLKVTYVQVRA